MATTTTQPTTQGDPECPLVGANHTCKRRDGRVIVNGDATCFEGARLSVTSEAA